MWQIFADVSVSERSEQKHSAVIVHSPLCLLVLEISSIHTHTLGHSAIVFMSVKTLMMYVCKFHAVSFNILLKLLPLSFIFLHIVLILVLSLSCIYLYFIFTHSILFC